MYAARMDTSTGSWACSPTRPEELDMPEGNINVVAMVKCNMIVLVNTEYALGDRPAL